MKTVYLDNNATTKVDQKVVEAMLPYFTDKYANPSSLHFLGRDVSEQINKSRNIIAGSIGASPEEIFFTASGSEGDNLCIKGFAEANRNFGNHIITSVIEHPAVINSCRHLEAQGFEITYLGVNNEGFIEIEELKKTIKPSTILVSIMHVNNEIGTIQPIKAISSTCHLRNIAFHTDAVQGYLKEPIDVDSMGIDMASFSGHKIHGPKGIGFVYIRKGITVTRQIDGGSQESNLRAGTENSPYIIGLAKAVEISSESDRDRMRELQKNLIESITNLKGFRLNGPSDLSKRAINNVNISSNFIGGDAILKKLSSEGICVSTGSACSSKSVRVSPVLEAIRCPIEYIHGNIRISLSKFTTQEEINVIINSLRQITQKTNALLSIENI